MIKPQPEGQGKFNSEQVRSVVSRLHALVAEPAAVECNPPLRHTAKGGYKRGDSKEQPTEESICLWEGKPNDSKQVKAQLSLLLQSLPNEQNTCLLPSWPVLGNAAG